MRKKLLLTGAALLIVGATACDNTGLAYGDANSIIAVMTPELWEDVSDDVRTVLQPTVRTVRNEKKFTVTYQDPMGDYWGDLRRFRQLLLVGTAEDPWMQAALDKADDPITEPGIHQVTDIWARDQLATLILLPSGGGAPDVVRHLDAIIEMYDEQFRQWVQRRMYVSSGIDTALADTLYLEAGFSLMLPEVYRWELQDSVYIFRNDQPDPSELIRQIAVTWTSPVPVDLQPEDILAWREAIVSTHYSEAQAQILDDAVAGPLDYRGNYAYEIAAEWRNPPERGWPAGGPFITRAIVCENQARMYLVDAWLYAPAKEKYEYMIQLSTILDTFRCGVA